jgi:hypothetical protein
MERLFSSLGISWIANELLSIEFEFEGPREYPSCFFLIKNRLLVLLVGITTLWDVQTSPALDGAVVSLNRNDN